MYKVGDRVRQILKEEWDEKMTFPEMAQKLIDGEFEVGTKLTMKDPDSYEKTYEVIKNEYGYGIDNNDTAPSSALPSRLNATWTVKEQPIKEMSLEELQKELGYKIKIVERESK